MKNQDEMMTRAEAARLVNRDVRALTWAIEAGKLQCTKIGGHVFVSPKAVVKMLADDDPPKAA